jgi:hypothetical protein
MFGKPIKDCLTKSSHIIKSSKIRDRLIKNGLKENKCERCGITEWLG